MYLLFWQIAIAPLLQCDGHDEWQPVLDMSNIEKNVLAVLDRIQEKLCDKKNDTHSFYEDIWL